MLKLSAVTAVWFLAGLTAVTGLGAALRRRRVTGRYGTKPRLVMNGGKGGLLVVGLNPAQQSILRFGECSALRRPIDQQHIFWNRSNSNLQPLRLS